MILPLFLDGLKKGGLRYMAELDWSIGKYNCYCSILKTAKVGQYKPNVQKLGFWILRDDPEKKGPLY